jgi:O-antigen/teichoic acid export membrane protein
MHRIKAEFHEGLYFSTGLSAQTVYNDIDKTMLARLSTLDAVGIYAAAYRLIDVAFIPVRSVMAAAYPGFFRSGSEGIAGSIAYGRRLLKSMAFYSAGVGAIMLALAPLVPHILGAEYARTAEALRYLALLPLLKSIHYVGADSLTAAGYQWLRTLVQTIIAVFNVLINLWVIRAYSWRGAAWSSLASDGLLAVILWSCALTIVQRKHRAPLLRQSVAIDLPS